MGSNGLLPHIVAAYFIGCASAAWSSDVTYRFEPSLSLAYSCQNGDCRFDSMDMNPTSELEISFVDDRIFVQTSSKELLKAPCGNEVWKTIPIRDNPSGRAVPFGCKANKLDAPGKYKLLVSGILSKHVINFSVDGECEVQSQVWALWWANFKHQKGPCVDRSKSAGLDGQNYRLNKNDVESMERQALSAYFDRAARSSGVLGPSAAGLYAMGECDDSSLKVESSSPLVKKISRMSLFLIWTEGARYFRINLGAIPSEPATGLVIETTGVYSKRLEFKRQTFSSFQTVVVRPNGKLERLGFPRGRQVSQNNVSDTWNWGLGRCPGTVDDHRRVLDGWSSAEN